MTNGEKLIEVFPSIGFYEKAHDGIQINFNSVWFNAEYKEPNCSEIPTGSTTKDYLGVDAISRAEVLKLMQDNWHTHNGDWAMQESMDDIRALPSVTPQEPRCKDCKWWKDSDGKYRRGCGAESICRINTDKVYQGEGYCYMFESQKSEG